MADKVAVFMTPCWEKQQNKTVKELAQSSSHSLCFLDISEYLALFIKYQLVYQYLLLQSLEFLDNKILNVQFCSSSILQVFCLLQS